MVEHTGKILPFLGALITVTLTAISQTCLKLGMNSVTSKGQPVETVSYLLMIALNPFIIAGIAGYVFGTFLWLYVLSRLPLSTAYPFVGLSIVLTSIFGGYYLGEPSSTYKIIGVLLVGTGVVLVSRG